jgi:hypothetical protein
MVPTINELVTILTRGYSPGYVMTGCPGHQLSPLLYKAGFQPSLSSSPFQRLPGKRTQS